MIPKSDFDDVNVVVAEQQTIATLFCNFVCLLSVEGKEQKILPSSLEE